MKSSTAGFLALALLLAPLAQAQVPPPAATPCEVIVSGWTASLESIAVAAVGQEIPATYSPTVKNTPGMSWYVSQHYALKTDHDEATARRYLTYAELAYPLHVWIVGRAPPEQERLRMPFVMGSSHERMLDAIETDGGWRPAGIGGGGITYWQMNTAYNYPSGTLQYHQRDLVLHENLHLLQMCSGAAPPPLRLLEGITHTSSNHVYDEAAQRLTLAVFDKPTVNSPTTDQLREIRSRYMTFREVCQTNSHICLFTAFMWSDPARLLGWRAWRDAMFWEGRGGEDLLVMEEIFGSLDGRIEEQWKDWLGQRHVTFRYRDWGWEQSGDTLIAYGWPQQGPYSRTDILLPPAEKPAYDPLRMDYPLQPMSTLVGPVQRGVEEPAVGALISFERCPGRGLAGIGLGVRTERPTSELSYLTLLIQGGHSLVMQGSALGLPDETVPLPEELEQAMTAGGCRIGLTARIRKDSLEVTLRARAAGTEAAVESVHSWPIDTTQRARLLQCPGTILAKDGYHAITPCFDQARRPELDLTTPAPPNPWRFAGWERLEALYRARRRLGAEAPGSLRALEARLLLAADKDPRTQQGALDVWAAQVLDVLRDVRTCEASDELRAGALADLRSIPYR